MSYWEQRNALSDHLPPWVQGDATDVRGQLFRLLKFDAGLTPAAGMPLIFKNPGYVFGQVLAAGIADGSITSAKILDGTITNADINAAAAIAYSKLNLANSIQSSDIVDGTIANVDINAAAAIAQTKLASTDLIQKLATASLTLPTTGTPSAVPGTSTVGLHTLTGRCLIVGSIGFTISTASAGVLLRARIAGVGSATIAIAHQFLYDATPTNTRRAGALFAIGTITNTGTDGFQITAEFSGAGPAGTINFGNNDTGLISARISS